MKLPLPKPSASQQIKKHNPQQLNKILAQLSAQFRQATAKGDYLSAHKYVSDVLKYVPNHVIALMDKAFTELRLERYSDAYKNYVQAIKHSGTQVDTNIYDGLTEVCHQLNKTEETRQYGQLALKTKMQQVSSTSDTDIPSERPKFNPAKPEENIIAFSLFGGDPRYGETAILNVQHAKEIYPEWRCRIYLNDTVPETVQQRLKDEGAQVVRMTEQQSDISGLFWRFLVMDDPSVRFFLIRDADSLVSWKEQAAVQAWLNSDRWFHSLRDYYSHTELILAGMWGGCNGVFQGMENMIREYMQTGNFLTSRVADQHFLRHCIWPVLRQSLISHDSQGYDENAQPFPEYTQFTDYETADTFHVGSNMGAPVICIQVEYAPGTKIRWALVDADNHQICAYDATVPASGEIEVNLPRNYTDRLQTQNWKIQVFPDTKQID